LRSLVRTVVVGTVVLLLAVVRVAMMLRVLVRSMVVASCLRARRRVQLAGVLRWLRLELALAPSAAEPNLSAFVLRVMRAARLDRHSADRVDRYFGCRPGSGIGVRWGVAARHGISSSREADAKRLGRLQPERL
jgi:hypothetical protein